jgi:hypothetical protein
MKKNSETKGDNMSHFYFEVELNGSICPKRVNVSQLRFKNGVLILQSVRDYFQSLGYNVGVHVRKM